MVQGSKSHIHSKTTGSNHAFEKAIKAAIKHLQENLGKGTKNYHNSSYSQHSKTVWEHTGIRVIQNASHQVLVPHRDTNNQSSTWIIEADPESRVSHVGVQCLLYKELYAQANTPTSADGHRDLLARQSDDVYTCSAAGHVLVDMDKYNKGFSESEESNPYWAVTQRACDFFYHRPDASGDTEQRKSDDEQISGHALRGVN